MSEGVYYDRRDYAGFWRRLAVDAIDFPVLFILVVLVSAVLISIFPNPEAASPHILFWSGVVISFLYLVVLKRSSLRTLGYRLGRVRIVGLQGERPSIWQLTLRAIFVFLGPLSMVVDVLWLTSDSHRQALRDKFAHTYVIRSQAVPVGHGPVVHATYTILGTGFLFAEVRTAKSHDP